jgi:hypothetical protein
MSGQSKSGSALEAVTNIGIGLLVSLIANAFVFPRYDFHPSLSDNIEITLIYTVISFVRSYGVRRAFNSLRKHFATDTGKVNP